ncbi:hypothetical protein [Hymenobacter nivis]|uniref:hypothetical protein n=1 Tax=Hymenobacter nivis TaxID=1850093 RepID=UPI0018789F7E|nr:hypothetical protein [Hymenobacter nivis]
MRNLLASATLFAALLFAGTAHAQQTVVKTKTKSARNAAKTAANATTTPPPAPLAPPVGGPQRPGGPNAGPGPLPGGPDGGPGRGPQGPGPKGGPGGPRGGQVQALTDVRGTLTAYQALNDEQVYDAFVLRADGAPADTVHFPRHIGQQLMAAAKTGSAVTVSGFRQAGPDGRNRFHFVSLTSGSQTVADARPTPPATPPTETSATVRGTVRELRRGPNGRVRSLVLSDQTVLQLSPIAVEQLADKLTVGASLEATGAVRTARPGEALATTTPARVVHAETLTLGGTKYLVR